MATKPDLPKDIVKPGDIDTKAIADAVSKWMPAKESGLLSAIIGIGIIIFSAALVMLGNYFKDRKIAKVEHENRVLESQLHDIAVTDAMRNKKTDTAELERKIDKSMEVERQLKEERDKAAKVLQTKLDAIGKAKSWSDLNG